MCKNKFKLSFIKFSGETEGDWGNCAGKKQSFRTVKRENGKNPAMQYTTLDSTLCRYNPKFYYIHCY
jgi:hypothetical protein